MRVLSVHRRGTSVYRKNTHTGRSVPAVLVPPWHPLAHKKSVITTLFHRATALSSDMVERVKENRRVTRALKNNGSRYPASGFIHRSSKSLTPPPTSPDRDGHEDREPPPKPRATITLPYVQGLSEPIKRLLSRLDIQVRFRANTTLRRMLMRPKHPVPQEERVGVIYKIPCRDCTKTYVRQSGRTLAMRLKEHQRAVRNGDVNASAIAEHVWNEHHRMWWTRNSACAPDCCWSRGTFTASRTP